MTRTRSLHDPADPSGKTWTTECEGTQVRVLAGSAGKLKETRKDFDEPHDALAYALKQEWTRLKKGQVLVHADAAPGEPRMHRYLGGTYTGAMPVADLDGRLLCSWHDADTACALLAINAQAQAVGRGQAPPKTLVWQATPHPPTQQVLLLADHAVWTCDPQLQAMQPLTQPNAQPASFLSVAADQVAWYAQGQVEVHTLVPGGVGTRRLQLPVQPTLYSGHSMQMSGALSAQGLLALCTQAGQIRFIDVASGSEQAAWTGPFEMVTKLQFTPDGRWLLVQEGYGKWALLALDMQSRSPRADWPTLNELGQGDFALSPSGTQLAVSRRDRISVYDMATMQLRMQFVADHVVKRCALTWLGEHTLGLRTDYGCASLYAV